MNAVPAFVCTKGAAMNIRHAKPEDAEQLVFFIRQLAAHQGFESSVKTSAAELGSQIAQEKKPFECLVAEAGSGRLLGFAMFFVTYSSWEGKPGYYLEDVFVLPEARGTGLGRQLISHIAQMAVDNGYARMDWNVLNTNAEAKRFYERLGARELLHWHHWRFDSETIASVSKAVTDSQKAS